MNFCFCYLKRTFHAENNFSSSSSSCATQIFPYHKIEFSFVLLVSIIKVSVVLNFHYHFHHLKIPYKHSLSFSLTLYYCYISTTQQEFCFCCRTLFIFFKRDKTSLAELFSASLMINDITHYAFTIFTEKKRSSNIDDKILRFPISLKILEIYARIVLPALEMEDEKSAKHFLLLYSLT